MMRDSPLTRPYPEMSTEDEGSRAGRATVLLCGQDTPFLQKIATLLKEVGIGVSCCEGPSQFTEMAVAQKVRPQIIVIEMDDSPRGQPVNLLMLRKLSPAAVIAVSALSDDESMARALNDGADYYLVKPFGNAEFLARIRALLRRR